MAPAPMDDTIKIRTYTIEPGASDQVVANKK